MDESLLKGQRMVGLSIVIGILFGIVNIIMLINILSLDISNITIVALIIINEIIIGIIGMKLYKGHEWARWVMIVFFLLGIILSLKDFQLKVGYIFWEDNMNTLSPNTIFVVINTIVMLQFIFHKSVKRFMAYKRKERCNTNSSANNTPEALVMKERARNFGMYICYILGLAIVLAFAEGGHMWISFIFFIIVVGAFKISFYIFPIKK
ncbi:MAG: hypothetical protein N4A57_06420 [Anaeromicrobium sp.]|jgi:hypothetical protein|uniref:hypothetical protein n=1 Tax=Anaeromicrobium sp. TaxID=1929132 RepID=UPI0025E294AE|nr:hypothetical protein [Anaeromicrobium sp.]MCT4593887.1 hypothetical protein [Anaeromicrobium sp.]